MAGVLIPTELPEFTYTGTYKTEMKNGYWYIFFLTSGTLRMTYAKDAQVYIHGGGGGGGGGAPKYGGIGAKGLPYGAQDGASAGANTGAGGAGGNYADGDAAMGPTGVGGSGIVIIRNSPVEFYPIVFNDSNEIKSFTYNRQTPSHFIFNTKPLF